MFTYRMLFCIAFFKPHLRVSYINTATFLSPITRTPKHLLSPVADSLQNPFPPIPNIWLYIRTVKKFRVRPSASSSMETRHLLLPPYSLMVSTGLIFVQLFILPRPQRRHLLPTESLSVLHSLIACTHNHPVVIGVPLCFAPPKGREISCLLLGTWSFGWFSASMPTLMPAALLGFSQGTVIETRYGRRYSRLSSSSSYKALQPV